MTGETDATPSRALRYAFAAFCVAVALALKFGLASLLGRETPFLLLFGAIVLSAWYGGLGPALSALALACLAADFFFLPPYFSLTFEEGEGPRLAVFIAEASMLSLLTVHARTAQLRALSAAQARRIAQCRLQRENRARRALSAANESLIRADSQDALFHQICENIVDIAEYQMCWIGRAEHDPPKTVRPIASAGLDNGFLASVPFTWADTDHDHPLTGAAIRTGRPVVLHDLRSLKPPVAWLDAARARGYAAAIALPIRLGDEIFGAFTIYASEPGAFDEDELLLLAQLADDVAYGIRSLRAREAEMRARSLLAEERDRFESVVMQMPVAMAVCAGKDLTIRLANARWRSFAGGLTSPVGARAGDSLSEPIRSRALAVLEEVRTTGQPRTLDELQLELARNGARRTLHVSAALEPLRDFDGKVSGIVIVVTDMTDQVLARQAAITARAAAEQASRAKDEFVRVASHELRTPLTPIIGWAQLLKRASPRDPQQVERGLDVILQRAREEARLVGDLLDMSHFMVGDFKMDRQDVDMGPIVEKCVEGARPAAEARGVQLEAAIASGARVSGDPVRLEQVARNLLSNALKFTGVGGQIGVELACHDGRVVFGVRDTGRGIAAAELAQIFDALRPGDRSMTRRESGIGLGLSLVRAIVEAHGGRVRGESAGRGLGATFVVELPASGREDEHAGTA